MLWFFKRHGPWLSSALLGTLLIAAGVFFVSKGVSTRSQIRSELTAEQITTSKDASMPGVPVVDAATAQSEADAIKGHTFGRWGPYAKMDAKDPNRAVYLDGLTLRTALGLAVAGFGVSDMAVGAGLIILIAGLATLVLAAPALFLLAGVVFPRQGKGGPSQLTSARP